MHTYRDDDGMQILLMAAASALAVRSLSSAWRCSMAMIRRNPTVIIVINSIKNITVNSDTNPCSLVLFCLMI